MLIQKQNTVRTLEYIFHLSNERRNFRLLNQQNGKDVSTICKQPTRPTDIDSTIAFNVIVVGQRTISMPRIPWKKIAQPLRNHLCRLAWNAFCCSMQSKIMVIQWVCQYYFDHHIFGIITEFAVNDVPTFNLMSFENCNRSLDILFNLLYFILLITNGKLE